MYHFFITTENGQIVKAVDVKDALERGEPDYYGICTESSILEVGKSVLGALLQWTPPYKAGQSLEHILEHYDNSNFTDDNEHTTHFFLLPITKRLYFHRLHLQRCSPYLLREDGRGEFDQLSFAKWLLKQNSRYGSNTSLFDDFQSIIPLMILAWHQNQPTLAGLEEVGVKRLDDGQVTVPWNWPHP